MLSQRATCAGLPPAGQPVESNHAVLCCSVRPPGCDVGSLLHARLQALTERRRWDFVVFDPPKLAPSRKTLEKATRKYRRLNAMAMKVRGTLLGCASKQPIAGCCCRMQKRARLNDTLK